MLTNAPPSVFVVHRDVSLVASDTDALFDGLNVRIADFDRSILEQFEETDDLLVLEWGLEVPDARGVLDTIRQSAPETRVLALTADVPEDDPIDRGADEYLMTPVSNEQLRSTIDRLVLQKAYEETMSEYFRLATERALLESELEADLDVTERYWSVTEELSACRARAAAIRSEFSNEGFERTLRRLLDE